MSIAAKELRKLTRRSAVFASVDAQPWAVEVDGQMVTVATDARGALIIRDGGSDLERLSKKVPQVIIDAVRPAPDAQRVSARRLLGFISHDVGDDFCRYCSGDGEIDCPQCRFAHICSVCRGTGTADVDERRGIIAGVLVNMALLTRFLRPLELGTDGDLMISRCANGALRVDDPDGAWTVILMRLRESDEAAGAFEDIDHPHMAADEARALVRRLDAELAEALIEEARAVSTRSPARRIATRRVAALREMRDMARTEGLVFVCSAAESAAEVTP